MKFQLAINLERVDDGVDMADVARHTLEMVQMAEAGGFEIVWAAEHHALEMTIAPNPLREHGSGNEAAEAFAGIVLLAGHARLRLRACESFERLLRATPDGCERRHHASVRPGRAAPPAQRPDAGATQEEILETIQLTTVMGIHSCNLAVPILMQEVAKRTP